MLTIKFIIYGIVMLVLSLLMLWTFFTSDNESKLTRVGFMIISCGFFLYSIGLFFSDEPTRATATFLLASGVVTSGMGYSGLKTKVFHIVLGVVLTVVLITRFML